MVSKEGKHFLNNTIKSLTHQNKVREENEMWKQFQRIKHRSEQRQQYFNDNRTKHHSKHGKNLGPNVWMRKLMELEESDPNRWGHSGFKELYPEEFAETDSQQSQHDSDKHSNSSTNSEKSVKCKKHSSKRKHKKHKKHKSKHKKKKK